MVMPMSWQPVTAHDAAMVGYTSRVKLTVPAGTSTIPESARCAPPDEQAPAASIANRMTTALFRFGLTRPTSTILPGPRDDRTERCAAFDRAGAGGRQFRLQQRRRLADVRGDDAARLGRSRALSRLVHAHRGAGPGHRRRVGAPRRG